MSDNGTGIPKAVATHLFQPGMTTKGAHGGSGLGLSTARDIARAAGGELAFTTRVGAGTTFLLTLPLAPPPEEPA